MFGQKHGNRFDANQELLALGAGNLMAGLGRGFPVSGGMSQSLVNESAGARTPVSGLVAALFTLGVVLFASGLLRNLPQPVLAAIVLAAVMGLVDIRALQHIWRFSRAEFLVAIAALVGVLGSGPVNGVLLGAAMSIVLLLRQAARPRVTELARIPGTTHFADRVPPPENESIPGVLVVRCESSLLYFNVEFVRERLFEMLIAFSEPPACNRRFPWRRAESSSCRGQTPRRPAPHVTDARRGVPPRRSERRGARRAPADRIRTEVREARIRRDRRWDPVEVPLDLMQKVAARAST